MKIIFDTVGKCIYCGSDQYAMGATRKLGAEHIVPDSLNGDLLLPEASCQKCERAINTAENAILRHGLLNCRKFLKLRSKKPKREDLILFDQNNRPVYVPPDVAPRFYPRLSSLWRFVWPILAVARASWAGAELRIERSA